MTDQECIREFKERISPDAYSVMPTRLCREVVTLVEEERGRIGRQQTSILKYQEGEATAHATIADLRTRNDQQRETVMWQFEERDRVEELASSLAEENARLKARALDATIVEGRMQDQIASLREQWAQVMEQLDALREHHEG